MPVRYGSLALRSSSRHPVAPSLRVPAISDAELPALLRSDAHFLVSRRAAGPDPLLTVATVCFGAGWSLANAGPTQSGLPLDLRLSLRGSGGHGRKVDRVHSSDAKDAQSSAASAAAMNPFGTVQASNLLTTANPIVARTFPILAPPICMRVAHTRRGIQLMNKPFQIVMHALRWSVLLPAFTLTRTRRYSTHIWDSTAERVLHGTAESPFDPAVDAEVALVAIGHRQRFGRSSDASNSSQRPRSPHYARRHRNHAAASLRLCTVKRVRSYASAAILIPSAWVG